ncbi:unnamed protein product [Calypogeia fissa]
MGYHSGLLFHRLLLLPFFVMLMLTVLYTSPTFRNFSPVKTRLSSLQDGIFPISLNIKDVVFRRHHLLNVEDARGVAKAEPVSRRHTNAVDSVDVQESNRNHILDENSVGEKPIKPEREEEEKQKEIPSLTVSEESANRSGSHVDQKLAGDDSNVDGDLVFSTEAKEHFGAAKEDIQLGNRRGDIFDDQSGPHEDHGHTPVEVTDVIVTEMVAAPSPGEQVEFTNSGSEFTFDAESFFQEQTDDLARIALPQENLNFPDYVIDHLDLNVPLRGASTQGVPLPKETSCEGRRAYLYTLPPKFNSDLVAECDSLWWIARACDYYMINEGIGPNAPTDWVNDRGEKVLVPDGGWFLTHQYALELMFHARLKHYECLTTDVNKADLFFLPYYAGHDVMRLHYRDDVTNDERDELALELKDWLEEQETWNRNNGSDHVLVVGKVEGDFRRWEKSNFGSQLLNLPFMAGPTKLLIERDAWRNRHIGVPHPTFFHPKNDDEIRTWLEHVEQSERRHLVSFAGMPRPYMAGNVRGHLIQLCLDHPEDCSLLKCEKDICLRPDQTMNLFLHSHFCMQPPGDTPTRRSVFDSLVGGCIPVLVDPHTAYYQYPWHLPRNASSYSVFIPSDDVNSGKSNILAILRSITPEERAAMRTRIIREIIPGLLYRQPGTKHSDFRDAFDISMEALFHRFANLKAETRSGT